MSQSRRRLMYRLFRFFDMIVLIACFIFAGTLDMGQIEPGSLLELLSIRIKIINIFLFLSLLLVWHMILVSFGIYRSYRFSNRLTELYDFFKAITVIGVTTFVGSRIFDIKLVSPKMATIFWISAFMLSVANRYTLRFILAKIRMLGRNLRFILIIGTNVRATELARRIQDRPDSGYRVVGFVDDEWTRLGSGEEEPISLVCNFAGLPDFLRNNVVDEVHISLPIRSFYDMISKIVSICEEQGILVRFVPEVFNLSIGKTRLQQTEKHPIITVYTGSMGGWGVLLKRFIDIFGSASLLVLLSPILLATALFIKLTSPGPVFFIQKRVGLNKRIFPLYKFRTMVVDAETRLKALEALNEAEGPVFKIKNDPRITPIGKFLRKISIDELPQLLNVLKGDMSLVGPRPLPVRDYEGFDQDWHRRRFSVRPGITCLWQVGGRSEICFSDWMELDMQYIDNWSLWLDLKILLKTIPAVLRGDGAQ